MSKEFRIVLSDNLFPVQAFFNAMSEDSFIQTLEAFSNGVGASFNDCHCEFPGDLGPDDDPIAGVQFALHDQEIVISNSEFLKYLTLTCKSYASERPDLEKAIFGKLEVVKDSMG
jgi:hypothetical protein